jgi:hypothetical protein
MTQAIEDWRAEIVKGVIVRQHLAELDQLYAYPLPEVAATDDELRRVERELGFPLDPQYRTFLGYANGWRSFLQHIDLFGTPQLAGEPPMDTAQAQLAAVDRADFGRTGFDLDGVLPIGASTEQADMWLLGSTGRRRAGQVLWFWGSDFELYPGFDEFYLAMLDYNRLELQRLQQESGGPR